jgi:hypothetical protein
MYRNTEREFLLGVAALPQVGEIVVNGALADLEALHQAADARIGRAADQGVNAKEALEFRHGSSHWWSLSWRTSTCCLSGAGTHEGRDGVAPRGANAYREIK